MKTKIQELRKQNKVTQEELALALGVTRQTIISLENGKYNASLQLAFKISRFFGKSIEDIFLYEGRTDAGGTGKGAVSRCGHRGRSGF